MRHIKDWSVTVFLTSLFLGPFIGVGFFLLGAGNENQEPYLVGKGGDSPFNQFEIYSFRHNQHRCFVAVKQDGNIDLDCP